MKNTVPALIMGLHYSSLQIAASLGRKGIPIFGHDRRGDAIGLHSRYVRKIEVPQAGEGLKNHLIDFAKKMDKPIVYFPLSDEYLIFLVEYWEPLSDYYFFPMSKPEVVAKLVSKTQTSGILSQLGISHPKTIVLKKGCVSFPSPNDIPLPYIIKPNYKHKWENDPKIQEFIGYGNRVLLIKDSSTLQEAIKILNTIDDMILQEFIPGSSESYYYYVGYRDRKGRIVTSYLGNKIRTLPDCLGSETLLKSVHNLELLKYGDEILHRLDLNGPAGIDFKYDPRDNKFKVVEINCRIGINDCYLAKFGIDLPYLYYLDSQKIEVKPQRNYPANVTWYDPFRDLDWMREYHSSKGVSWVLWLMQLFRHDTYALFDWSDPAPFMKAILQLLIRIMRKTIPSRG
jgi:D-aspartate ligase